MAGSAPVLPNFTVSAPAAARTEACWQLCVLCAVLIICSPALWPNASIPQCDFSAAKWMCGTDGRRDGGQWQHTAPSRDAVHQCQVYREKSLVSNHFAQVGDLKKDKGAIQFLAERAELLLRVAASHGLRSRTQALMVSELRLTTWMMDQWTA